MSSRRSKKSASNRYPTNWSEWEWNGQHDCYARYREKKENDFEWDYNHGPVLAEPGDPMTECTESAYLDPSGEQPRRKQNSRNTSHPNYHDDANPPDYTQSCVYNMQDTVQQGDPPENGMADITNGLSQTTLSSEGDHYSHDDYYQDQYPQGYSPYLPSSSQLEYAQQPHEPPREKKMKTIRGRHSPYKHEVLDHRYKIHKDSEFQIGRVFALLWHGPNSNIAPNDSVLELDSDITDSEIFNISGSRVLVKFRRFVVIDSGNDKSHSICLPIRTYGYRGVTKPGLHPGDHAAICSSKKRGPIYLPAETDSCLILKPIHVELSQTHFKFDKLSRLNYANPYAIEHNVKARFIGRVAKHDERQLIEDFNRISSYDESTSNSKRDMNQPVDETSGVYPNQGQSGPGEKYRPKNGDDYVQFTAENGQVFRDYGGQYMDEYEGDGTRYGSSSG